MKTARRWTCSLLGFCLWGLIGSLSIVESAAAHATEAGSDSIQFTYDLLLAGGYVIDPARMGGMGSEWVGSQALG